MPPSHGGGEMIMLVQLESPTYKAPPHKFEAGTPSIADCIVLGEAVDYLQGIGMAAIRAHEQRLTDYTLRRLAEVEGVTLFGPRQLDRRGGGGGFPVDLAPPHDVAQGVGPE